MTDIYEQLESGNKTEAEITLTLPGGETIKFKFKLKNTRNSRWIQELGNRMHSQGRIGHK